MPEWNEPFQCHP